MKKIIVIAGFMMACGISPHDADEMLESMEHDHGSWCGWKAPDPATMEIVGVVDHAHDENHDEIEKAFNHPDGFGITGTLG